MALKATLKIGSQTYDVRELDYKIEQFIDKDFKPIEEPRGGLITFTILSPMKGNTTFYEWIKSTSEKKSGKFTLPLTHGIEHVTKEISFKNAQCVSLQEYYSAGYKDASQMYMRIRIVASTIEFSPKVKYEHKKNTK